MDTISSDYTTLPGNDGRFDVIVVGAGHAGCEAAYAAARLGVRTLLLTMQLDMIAYMSCNPAIGGTAKGILVREIDALGGAMARITDQAGLHFRILNAARGPAVQSPRVQCDKRQYTGAMKLLLEQTPNLYIRQDTVVGLAMAGDQVTGVTTQQGFLYTARAVVLTTGTFMQGLIHIGRHQRTGGRAGESASLGLSDSLRNAGLTVERFKTGTPPRLMGKSIDFSKLGTQPPDDPPRPISFLTDPASFHPSQRNCFMTWTTPAVHDLVRENLHRAPLYDGQIQTVGPRYCPSFETKIVRFADKDRHQIFLEPEGRACEEYYMNGFSTSVPADVQLDAIRMIPGLENAEVMRFGYAIEYDYVPPRQIRNTYETRTVNGLYLAGQINGTSGYEEAAGQGLLAGANAALKILERDPIIIMRDEGYLGVMTDDLISKDLLEPYRLFTSRAEFRLMLRMDNALYRLGPTATRAGLLEPAVLDVFQKKMDQRDTVIERMTAERHRGRSLFDMLNYPDRTPDAVWDDVFSVAETISRDDVDGGLMEHILIESRYNGYIRRQDAERARLKRMENVRLPDDLDYLHINSLKIEARQTLSERKPVSLAHASRLPGITPADISALAIHLEKRRRKKA